MASFMTGMPPPEVLATGVATYGATGIAVAMGAAATGVATGNAIGLGDGTTTALRQRGQGTFFPACSSRTSITDLQTGQAKRIMAVSDALFRQVGPSVIP
jgi:hypothetical protein